VPLWKYKNLFSARGPVAKGEKDQKRTRDRGEKERRGGEVAFMGGIEECRKKKFFGVYAGGVDNGRIKAKAGKK